MSKRFDNKRLLYILGGLLIILALTWLVKVPRQSQTLKGNLIDIDTASIGRIIMYPRAENGKELVFTKEQNTWKIKKGDTIANTREGMVKNAISELHDLKPERLAATDRSKWGEYELTDSLGSRVKIFDAKGKTLADLIIGKISFGDMTNMYAGNNFQGTSFVRLTDDKNVYAINGFLSFSFNRKFNEWRDNTVIRAKTKDINKVTFTYASDSSFTLALSNSAWMVNNSPADSAKTAGYLNELVLLTGDEFRDKFVPSSEPVSSIRIEGQDLDIIVKCYKPENSDEFIINSSINPESWFVSSEDDLYSKLFKGEKYFAR